MTRVGVLNLGLPDWGHGAVDGLVRALIHKLNVHEYAIAMVLWPFSISCVYVSSGGSGQRGNLRPVVLV